MATQLGRESAQETAALIAQLGHIAEVIEEAESLKAERNRLVVELAERGYSEREIAVIARTTGPRVHQIKKEAGR